MKKIFLIVVLFVLAFGLKAQNIDNASVMQLVAQNAAAIGLQKDQATNLKLSSTYTDGGTQYVYLLQTYKGIPVFNQVLVLAFKDNKLISNAGKLIPNVEKISASASPSISASSAVNAAFSAADVAAPSSLIAVNSKDNGKVLNFGKVTGVSENVTAELMWLPNEKDSTLKLIWQVLVTPVAKADMWLMHVDAASGGIAGKVSLTVFETEQTFTGAGILAYNYAKMSENGQGTEGTLAPPPTVTSGTYNVIPFPKESPTHGTPAVVTNPWLNAGAGNNATTNGWHFDGTTNYDLTRGNNVHAYLDKAANNTPNQATNNFSAQSTTAVPALTFNFTPDFTKDPDSTVNRNFGVTNLFYWNNLTHDVMYQYGFTEVAGNFQTDNLSRGGTGNDYVQAEAQDAGGLNNANFGTPVDGARPRMQMFLWDAVPNVTLKVNTPAPIAGNYYAVESAFSTANKLAAVGPKTGQVVYFDDATGGTHLACTGAPANSLTGKIALILRGTCSFAIKVKEAQTAGAIAVIMVNNAPGDPIIMGGTDNTITIPAVMISDVNGALFAAQLTNNLNVTLSGTAGVRLDGDLDNGIIVHEYGHGISNRLTGGPANSSCLQNAEQAGEGWSDYVGLMMTHNWATAGVNDGALPRGIGTYAIGQPTSGRGIRNFPYSTNMTIQPSTYSGVQTLGGQVHAIGEIWCAAIWDMTWGIIQQENSINTNLFNFTPAGTGGNSIALKLVLEGMKLQPCSPGFLQSRDAIIQADQNLYAGRHFCTIWTAFARRGMGFSAVQGSSNNTNDQTQAFDMPPVGTFTAQPSSTTVCLGNPITFSVTVTGGTVTYQWQSSPDGTTWTNIAGATSAAYTFTPVATDNAKRYRCVATGLCGAVNSNVAVLTTTTVTVGGILSPAATNICVGASGNTTTLTLAGNIGNIIRWESSINGGTTWTSIANTTSTLIAINLTQTTLYRVVVQSVGCAPEFSSTATVTAVAGIGALTIMATPGAILCQGDPALLTVMTPTPFTCATASGTVGITITDNSPAGISNTLNVTCAAAGSVLSSVAVTLNITHTWDADVTVFLKSPTGRVINLINQRGGSGDNFTNTVISSASTTSLATGTAPFTGTFAPDANAAAPAPTGFTQTDASFATFITNSTPNGAWVLGARDNAGLDVGILQNWSLTLGYNALSPTPAGLTYTWTPAAGLASTTGNPVAASPAVSTTYTVNVSNGAGCTGSASIPITVNLRPAITTQPASVTLCEASTATFTVGATGTGITYQWQVSTNNCSTYTNITGATAATLTLTGITNAMNGNGYRCVVSGTCPVPVNSNCAKLTINALPVVAVTPSVTCGGVAGVNGVLLSTGSFAPPIPGSATFSAAPNLAIPDGPPTWPQTSFIGVSSTLPVAGIPANASITGVSVKLNIPHTYIADLVIVLKAPNGAVLNLDANISKTGGAGANFVNTIINSTSTTALSAGLPPYTGSFKPDAEGAVISQQGTTFPGGPTTPAGYIPTVQTFNGLYSQPNGNWSLGIYDWGAGDVGTLTNWELVINYTTPGGTGNPLTFTWSPAAGLYTDPTAATPYVALAQTPQVYAAPTTYTTYTVTGTNAATGCSNTATALVNYTPPAPTVTPNPVAICLGDVVKLKSSSSVSTVKSFTSGAINVNIPEGAFPNPPATAGVSTIAVSGIPANAVITNISVESNITHPYVGDVVMVLKNVNTGAVFNLDAMLNKTNNAGANFVRNVISQSGTTLLSAGTAPFTGTFKADAVGATFSAFGFTLAGGPVGYAPTTTSWNSLYANPNGNWTLATYDVGAPDLGSLTSWTLNITYVLGVPASPAVWSPVTGLYTDAGATTPYVAGTRVDSIYAKPAVTTPYSVNVYGFPGATGPSQPVNAALPVNNGNGLVTFNFTNSNSYPVIITDIASVFFFTGLPATTQAFYKPGAIAGPPGAISAANGWISMGTGSVALETGAVQPFLSGLSLLVPANTTYGLAVQGEDAFGANLGYNGTGAGPGLTTFSSGGCSIVTGPGIGYGGGLAPLAPTFTVRAFVGSVSFAPAGECFSPARSVTVTVNTPIAFVKQPVNATVCTDKSTTFSVQVTGSVPSHNWQVSTANGSPGTWVNIADGGVYSGSKTATLTITAPPLSYNSYTYRDSVSAASVCAAGISAYANLTVNPIPTVTIAASPYQRLFPGLKTTLFSTVTPAAASYTWLRNGAVVPNASASSLIVDVDGLGDYTLRVNDVNGCSNTSNLVSLKDSASGKVFIYPTPNSGQFQVRYYSIINNTGLPRGINIFDARGKRVFTQTYSIAAPFARMDVDLRNHGTGVYWIEVVDQSGNRLAMGRTEVLR